MGGLSPFLRLIGHLVNPAIYAKMVMSVDDVSGAPGYGQLHLKVVGLKIDHIDLTNNVNKMNAINTTIGADSWQRALAFSLGSLKVSNGQLHLYGTVPTVFDISSSDPGAICADYHGGSLLPLSPIDGHIASVVKSCPV